MGNIIMQCGERENLLDFSQWGMAFIGNDIDDRTKASTSFCRNHASNVSIVSYDAINTTIQIDNHGAVFIDDLSQYLSLNYNLDGGVIIDSTSINVAELLVLFQALYNIGKTKIDVLYLQPKHYNKTSVLKWERRSFDLSKQFDGYIGIPGQILYLNRHDKVVYLCGYESERIERSFEVFDIDENKTQLLFGAPPYEAGWDMNAYCAHLPIITQKRMNGSLYYCGASNPFSVMEKLELIYNGLSGDEKMFLVPVGTKPMAIGACAFKVSKNDSKRISVLYDHPHVSKGRSKDIAMWNLYNIQL